MCVTEQSQGIRAGESTEREDAPLLGRLCDARVPCAEVKSLKSLPCLRLAKCRASWRAGQA